MLVLSLWSRRDIHLLEGNAWLSLAYSTSTCRAHLFFFPSTRILTPDITSIPTTYNTTTTPNPMLLVRKWCMPFPPALFFRFFPYCMFRKGNRLYDDLFNHFGYRSSFLGKAYKSVLILWRKHQLCLWGGRGMAHSFWCAYIFSLDIPRGICVCHL